MKANKYIQEMKKIETYKGLDRTYERRNFRNTLRSINSYLVRLQKGLETSNNTEYYNVCVEALEYALEEGYIAKEEITANLNKKEVM